MRASWCDYWIRIALVMFTIGRVSANARLTILNNQSHLECGTMQTVLTCELQYPPTFVMHWIVDGTYVSECSAHSCDRKDGMKSNYKTTVTAAGNVFKLYINPVDIFDKRTITCTGGVPSNDINITTEQVKIDKSLTTITNRTVGDSVVFLVTTNCVFHPDAVKLSLESKKVNGGCGFTDFQVNSSNAQIVCSNTENAYCGGNKTSKANLNFTISTDKNGGEMHQFKLRIIQTLENGTNYTITFENDEIGQLKLPIPGTPLYWTIWVGPLVAGFVVIIILCIITPCCLKRRKTSRCIFKKMTKGLTTNRQFVYNKCKHTQRETDDEIVESNFMIPEDLPRSVSESLNVSVSFHRSDEQDESDVKGPEPVNVTKQDVPVTYEVVDEATSKGGKMLLDNLGYGFTQVKSSEEVTYWWCSHRSMARRCPATVVQRADQYRTGLHQHTHPAEPGMKHRVKIAKQVKSAARSNIFISAKSLVEAAFEELSANSFNRTDQDLLAKWTNMSRQMLRPAEPRGEDFKLVGQALPEGYLRYDITVDGARHLIFATSTQVEVLQKAKRLYMDSTFKVLRMNGPFTQLYSVHAFVNNDGGEAKQFPLVFIFMSRRRKRDYKEVFKKVKALTATASVPGFVMDFEAAAWSAIRTVFPQAQISGCVFHWTRAVWRKVQNLELAGDYQQDEGTNVFVRQLLALPLLRAEHIKTSFDYLQQKASEPLRPLMEYVESTWISGAWTPSDWSVYGQTIRTINDCEGWHRRLNFQSKRPTAFYSLVDQLHKASQRLTHQMRLVLEKKVEEKTKEEH